MQDCGTAGLKPDRIRAMERVMLIVMSRSLKLEERGEMMERQMLKCGAMCYTAAHSCKKRRLRPVKPHLRRIRCSS